MAKENTKNYIEADFWRSLFASTERPYYDVAGKVYYNKLEAIIETDKISKQTGIGPWFILRFNCFNSLSTVNFSVEPDNSYQQLCVQRAQQLRDKYKYIRLWYSGGVDSHTVLKSFYTAKLPIDEIVTVKQDDIGEYQNYEAKLVVRSNLEKIKNWFPAAKIRELDYSIDLSNNNFDSDKFQSKLLRLAPGWHLFRNVSSAFDLDQNLLEQYNSSHCELVGEPKPSVIKKDGKWYTYILDNTIEGVLPLPGLELFHLSRDFPQIYIKQCHMLKNNFEKLLIGKKDSDSKILDKDFEQKNIFLQRFNEWDQNNISQRHNKMAKSFAKNRDNPPMIIADLHLKHNAEFSNDYKKFTQAMQVNIYDKYINYFDMGDKWKSPKGMFSLFWCLDEHKSLTTDQLWPLGFGNY